MTYHVGAIRIVAAFAVVWATISLTIPASLAEQTNAANNVALRSDQDAFQTLIRRANKGDIDAQFELGRLYLAGVGFPRDYSQAFRWFEVASQKGSAQAQFHLGLMYFEGKGVTRSFSDAYMWFNIASALGSSSAVVNREQAGGHLTEKEVLAAQAKSREWLSSAGYRN